jgi:predicted phosphodiesterase
MSAWSEVGKPADRVAALYDIHGNLPALDAVLDEVLGAGVDRVVVGGDVIPGPMPVECLERLEALPVPVDVLSGNGEADLVTLAGGTMPARVPEAVHPILEWVLDRLGPRWIGELAGWPATVSLDIRGLGRVLFCHATPGDDNTIFTVRTPGEALQSFFEGVEADVVVCGHTHMPFDRRVGDIRVLNAGSVGMAFGSSEAHWLLLGPSVMPRRTSYDVPEAMERIARSGYPGLVSLDAPPSADAMLDLFDARSPGAPPAPNGGTP